MLQVGSQLNVSDNSGAKKVECIKVLGKHSKSPAFLGEFVVVSIKEHQTQSYPKTLEILNVFLKLLCILLFLHLNYPKHLIVSLLVTFFI
jgi:hypothetical protein